MFNYGFQNSYPLRSYLKSFLNQLILYLFDLHAALFVKENDSLLIIIKFKIFFEENQIYEILFFIASG
jgi:hypothetical protein